MRSIAGAIKTLILILVFASGISLVHAAPPVIATGSAFVTDKAAPWDGIARIGDTVSFTVYYDSDLDPTNALAIVPGVNNPNINMTETRIGGGSYTATINWPVVQGTSNDLFQKVRFIVANASGGADITFDDVIYKLDNVRPERAGIMTASVTSLLGVTSNYTGLPVIKGERVSFYQKMTTSDTDQSANLDLGNILLAAVNPMNSADVKTEICEVRLISTPIDYGYGYLIGSVEVVGNQIV